MTSSPVGFCSCRFVVVTRGATDRDVVERRLAALGRFYAPLGPVRVVSHVDERWGLVRGAIAWDGRPAEADGIAGWGGMVPDGLRSVEALAGATDERLRCAGLPSAVFAVSRRRALILTGPGPL